METPPLIDIACVIRLAHISYFRRDITTAVQLKIAKEVVDNESADCYIVMYAKCCCKYNKTPAMEYLAHHVDMIQGASNEKGPG